MQRGSRNAIQLRKKPQPVPQTSLKLQWPLGYDLNWNKELGLCALPTPYPHSFSASQSSTHRKYTGPRNEVSPWSAKTIFYYLKDQLWTPQQTLLVLEGMRVLVVMAGSGECAAVSTTGVDNKDWGGGYKGHPLSITSNNLLFAHCLRTPESKNKFVNLLFWKMRSFINS